jgi:hypothetical protein
MASLGEDDAEAVVAAAVAKAKSGDGPMLRCLVTRILPAVRSRPVELAVPDGRETDIRALHDATLKGLAQGDILPDEALMIACALEKMARALATAAAAATPQPRRRGKPRSPSPLVGEGRGGGRPAAVRAGERPSDAHPHPALPHRGGGCGEAAPANRLFPPAAADGDGPEKEIVGIRELEGSGGSDARGAQNLIPHIPSDRKNLPSSLRPAGDACSCRSPVSGAARGSHRHLPAAPARSIG